MPPVVRPLNTSSVWPLICHGVYHTLAHINLTRASGVLVTDAKSTLNAVSAECQDD